VAIYRTRVPADHSRTAVVDYVARLANARDWHLGVTEASVSPGEGAVPSYDAGSGPKGAAVLLTPVSDLSFWCLGDRAERGRRSASAP
jgi:hypothetical protein